MKHLYDNDFDGCDSSFCELATGIVSNFIFIGLIFAIVVKLLRFDRLGYLSLNLVFLTPIFVILVAWIILFPIVSIALVLKYLNIFNDKIWLASTIVIIIIAAILLIKNKSNNNSYSIPLWDLKGWYKEYEYQFRRFLLLDKIECKKRNNEEYLSKLDKAIYDEIEQRFWHQLVAIRLFIFLYFWLKDIELFHSIFIVLDDLFSFIKYSLLFSLLAFLIYGYTKYYDIFGKKYFEKIIFIAKILEKEKKYIYFKDKNPKGFVINIKKPQALEKKSKYYYFDFFKDNDEEIYAYWISPSIDYRHYLNVMK